MRDHVLVEDDDVVEPFKEVEGDLRLPLGCEATNLAKVVVDRQHLYFVAHRGQCGNHVVLGAPRRGGDVRPFLDPVGRHEVPVDERHDPQLIHAHRATRCRPLWR